MKKKNLLTAAASLALVGVIGAGATLAYFTSQTETVQNVFTTGNVNITLVDETEGPADGDQWDAEKGENGGIHYTNVMPGDDLSKQVGVLIDELSSNCYVGMQVTVSGSEKLNLSDIVEDIAGKAEMNGWYVKTEGSVVTCYYSEELIAGSSDMSAMLFDSIEVPTTWGNEAVNAEFDVAVKAAAVQSANLDVPNSSMDSNSVVELNELLK